MTCDHAWRDSEGKRIEAHGGGMLKDDEGSEMDTGAASSGSGLFFWYGQPRPRSYN